MRTGWLMKWALVAGGGLAASTDSRGSEPPCLGAGPAAPHVVPGEAGLTVVGGDDARSRVHVFAVNGLDPLCLAGLDGLCESLRGHGYRHARFGRIGMSHGFTREIREIRAGDPGARVVLMGYSYGCNSARSIANTLREEGVQVDLLVYIAGDLIEDGPLTWPDNVGRVVSIRARGMVVLGGDLFYNRQEITGARNVRLGCGHFSAPKQAETLAVVLEELAVLTPGPGCPCPPEGPAGCGR